MEIKLEINMPTKKGNWNRVFFVKGQSTKREARERSMLKNVSDCCKQELKQAKYCGHVPGSDGAGCGKPVAKVSQKALKIPGRDAPEYLSNDDIEKIEGRVADKRVIINKVMRSGDMPKGIGARIVKSWYLYPEEDSAKEMANIVAAMQEADCVFIGVLTVRGSEYESIFRPAGDGLLVAEMLCEPSQIYGTPEFECPAPNSQVVAMLANGFVENAATMHEFNRRDAAIEALEAAIFEFATTGVMPKAEDAVVLQDAQELEALQEVF